MDYQKRRIKELEERNAELALEILLNESAIYRQVIFQNELDIKNLEEDG